MSKIEKLLDQTSFLLDKQKEVKHETHRIFSELVAFVNQHRQRSAAGSETGQILDKIHDLLAGHAQRLAEEAQEDIQLLQENLEALLQIKEISNPEKADELLATLVDDEEELPDTQSFKRDVNEELALSKNSLLAMVEDVKEAIKEGEAEEIALLLEAMVAEHEEEKSHHDDDEDDDFEDEEEEGGCGSCSSGGCKSCTMGSHGGGSHGGKDIDLASFLSPYEIELARDLEKEKIQKRKKS